MTDLSKRESFYFIVAMGSALAILIGILAFWGSTQTNCWDQYHTEREAIENCEQ